jgi:hypothetical protein
MLLTASPADAARWNWSGSITLDHTNILDDPAEGEDVLGYAGSLVEWSLKATVDVSDRLSFNGRICTSCHGITVDQAYAEIRLHRRLSAEAGRINVPFGDFYLRHDPANDAFLSKPLPYAMGHMIRYQSTQFNLGVLPMPYVDHGASLFGDVWIRDQLQIWYAVYGVNGFQSSSPRDFTFKNQVADAGVIDNNDSPSWGGRLALAQGPFALGGSYLRGTYDPDGDYDYDAWGIDGSVYVRGIQLRGEYLHRGTDVLDDDRLNIVHKDGFYAQVEAPVGRYLDLVGRFDGLLREGVPLGTNNDESSAIVRFTVGANVKPTIDYAFRLQYERWRFTDFAEVDVLHLGAVITY